MDFALDPETEQLRELVAAIGEREIAPYIAEWDRAETFPAAFNAVCAQAGLLGGVLDEKYGGSGMSYLQMAVVLEELGYFCSMAGLVCGQPSCSLGRGLVLYADDAQLDAYLRPTLAGQRIGATAVTEAHSGTDVLKRMQTTARRDGDSYVLNGSKAWISNLVNADWFITFATVDKSAEHRGVCAFVVDKSMAGLSVHPYHEKVGARTFVSGDLVLDEVRVPAANRVGAEGEGYKVLLAGSESGRLSCAARAVGQLRRVLDLARRYATERIVFDAPIARYELVQDKIARMSTSLQAARLLTYRAAWLTDQGNTRLQKETSAAKSFATDALFAAADDAMQIFGAYSCSDEYEIGRIWRDARFSQIYDGANDVLSTVIGELELGLRGGRPATAGAAR
jgi:alkylation response protein AidB-like acyl-CoA dehydrogenase